MEKLLETARKVSDKAEVYSADSWGDSVSFEDAHLKDVQSSMQSGICLRIIKNNTLGFAYTKNLVNREPANQESRRRAGSWHARKVFVTISLQKRVGSCLCFGKIQI